MKDKSKVMKEVERRRQIKNNISFYNKIQSFLFLYVFMPSPFILILSFFFINGKYENFAVIAFWIAFPIMFLGLLFALISNKKTKLNKENTDSISETQRKQIRKVMEDRYKLNAKDLVSDRYHFPKEPRNYERNLSGLPMLKSDTDSKYKLSPKKNTIKKKSNKNH